jgi:hypothetical protein
MKKKFTLPLLIILLAVTILVYLLGLTPWGERGLLPQKIFRGIAWFKFDKQTALREWEEKIFKGRVLYSVKVDKIDGFLSAYSKSAASGIIYRLKFDPLEKPLVSWKWKVIKFPERKKVIPAKSVWIEEEDYAARFYIIFPKFPFFRVQCLEYVWDKQLPKGKILTNPYFKNLKIMVLESGEENLGKWVYVERNIVEDFKKAFGRNPGKVGAIAIMTDADNTLSTAEAQYDEVKVGYEK